MDVRPNIVRRVALLVGLAALLPFVWYVHIWWQANTLVAQSPELLRPAYAGRTAPDLLADLFIPATDCRIGLLEGGQDPLRLQWLPLAHVEPATWYPELANKPPSASGRIVVFGGLGLAPVLAQVIQGGAVAADVVPVTAAQFHIATQQEALSRWLPLLKGSTVVLTPGVADAVYARLHGASHRLALAHVDPLSQWDQVVGVPAPPCRGPLCPPRQSAVPLDYLRQLAADQVRHYLWEASWLAEANGIRLVVLYEPAPVESAESATWLDWAVRLQAPALTGATELDDQLAQIAKAVQEVAERARLEAIPLHLANGHQQGRWSGDLPLEANDIAGLAPQLRSALVAIAAQGLPIQRQPTPRSAAVALPAAASSVEAASQRDLENHVCVRAGCPAGMCLVPAGTYTSGYGAPQIDAMMAELQAAHGVAKRAWFDDDGPPEQANVSAFCMDVTEVSVAMQRACTQQGRCRPIALPRDDDAAPAILPTAGDAEDLCAFVGKRLPTDLEWEAAARGSTAQPQTWGVTRWSGTQANYCGAECPLGRPGAPDDGRAGPAPVTSFAAGRSPFGLLNLAGNVWEWVADCRVTNRSVHLRAMLRTDPLLQMLPGRTCRQLIRGGSFLTYASFLERRVTEGYPDVQIPTRGGRCVVDFGTHHTPILAVP